MRHLILIAALCACQDTGPSLEEIGVGLGVQVEGYRHGYHTGPDVFYVPGTGTDRFAQAVYQAIDAEAAMRTVEFVDAYYREPANEGYDAALDHVIAGLRAAGFGESEGLELRIDERPLGHLAWTPRSGSLTLVQPDGASSVLHHFDVTQDQDRCMLPVNAPSADVRAGLALSLEELERGEILVTDKPLGAVLSAAREAGAAAVLSSHLFEFNEDPTGKQRHLEAIHYGKVPVDTRLAVAQISPRVHTVIRERAQAGTELHLVARADLAQRPLRTVVAVVVGDERPQEVVALVAHVQEPGANDNGTGVAGLLEGARALVRSIDEGALARPRRSVAFVWGDEYGASRVFLETTERRTVAGISVDMIGASKAMTGAICLLERGPDPGALTTLPPDEHTPWGAGRVDPDTLFPNGLSVILRCALVDVGLVAKGWETREHPWEGGSDHDVFLNAGIAGALVWHFTDFAYHTSLDRMDMVDSAELHRTTAALVVGALGVADARVTDLRRYVESARAEGEERAGIVELEGAPIEVARQWVAWYQGTRAWLSALCNGEPVPDRYGR